MDRALEFVLFDECIKVPPVKVDASAHSHNLQFFLEDQVLHSLFATAQVHGRLFNSQESRLRVFVCKLRKLFLDNKCNFRRYGPGQNLDRRIDNAVLKLQCCAIERRKPPLLPGLARIRELTANPMTYGNP